MYNEEKENISNNKSVYYMIKKSTLVTIVSFYMRRFVNKYKKRSKNMYDSYIFR